GNEGRAGIANLRQTAERAERGQLQLLRERAGGDGVGERRIAADENVQHRTQEQQLPPLLREGDRDQDDTATDERDEEEVTWVATTAETAHRRRRDRRRDGADRDYRARDRAEEALRRVQALDIERDQGAEG